MYLCAIMCTALCFFGSINEAIPFAQEEASSGHRNEARLDSPDLLPHDGVVYDNMQVRDTKNKTVNENIGTITMLNYEYPDHDPTKGFDPSALGTFMDLALADIKTRMDRLNAAMFWEVPDNSFRYGELSPLAAGLFVLASHEEGVRPISWNDIVQILLTIRTEWVAAYAGANVKVPQSDILFFVEDLPRSIVPIRVGDGRLFPLLFDLPSWKDEITVL